MVSDDSTTDREIETEPADSDHADADQELDQSPPWVGDGETPTGLAASIEERPTVPVFYSVPEPVADRVVRRFKATHDGDELPAPSTLRKYIYDEIDGRPVMFVGGVPLAEYASEYGALTTADGSGSGDAGNGPESDGGERVVDLSEVSGNAPVDGDDP